MADYPERLSAESAQAYQAACAYFSLGADRSQEAVSQELAKSRQLLSRWSAQHAWASRAKLFDAELASEAAAQHSAAYLLDLEKHRKRASDAGEGVYIVASRLLQQLNRELDSMEMSPATLGVLLRAFVVSLDLSAWALGIDKLQAQLEGDTE